MITLQDIHKSYMLGSVPMEVLRGVSLTVEQGALIAIVAMALIYRGIRAARGVSGDDLGAIFRAVMVQATRAMASNSTFQPQESRAKWVSEPINPSWLWLTLVLSASILWLERKLDIA